MHLETGLVCVYWVLFELGPGTLVPSSDILWDVSSRRPFELEQCSPVYDNYRMYTIFSALVQCTISNNKSIQNVRSFLTCKKF